MTYNVNHPPHYQGDVECIDAIEASMTPEAFAGYCKGNILKYMWRYEKKDQLEGLLKARWYLNKLIEIKSQVESYEQCRRLSKTPSRPVML